MVPAGLLDLSGSSQAHLAAACAGLPSDALETAKLLTTELVANGPPLRFRLGKQPGMHAFR